VGSQRHDGTVALVSGASQGIGKAIALKMAAEGALVVGCARTKSALEEVGEEITAADGSAVMIAADVSKSDDARVSVTTSRPCTSWPTHNGTRSLMST